MLSRDTNSDVPDDTEQERPAEATEELVDPRLILGPLLRHVDETSATVWVESAVATQVAVRAGDRSWTANTFTAHGHHYCLVHVDGLGPGQEFGYTVEIDGDEVWPPVGSVHPPSRIRTLDFSRPLSVAFGSCRTSVAHDPVGNRKHGVDALRALSLRMMEQPTSKWPDLLLFLGDQVYADETSEAMREFITARRSIEEPPGEELKDYEEYAHLYRLAWTDSVNRWLLSTLPSAMIFDDHDIRYDWNTSAEWREEMARTSWWRDRIVGGLGSYWVYQHLGNLSPADRDQDPVWQHVRRTEGREDIAEFLDDHAEKADAKPDYYRWSYSRDLGRTRLIVIDSRCARVLEPGTRQILDASEMDWLDGLLQGDRDHVLVGTSLPFLLPAGLHHLEAWDEAVADGAWGGRGRKFGERIRQGADLEHWAAFQKSFQRVAAMARDVVNGRRGSPPATVIFLSGDVHHSYLAEVALPEPTANGRILQAVCSPIRNPMPRSMRFAFAAMAYGFAWPTGRAVARSAKVPEPPFTWRITKGPWFENSIARLDITGRDIQLCWEKPKLDSDDSAHPQLHPVGEATIVAPRV